MRFLISTNIRDAKGLARDAEILSDLLTGWGHSVVSFDFRSAPPERQYDVTIHLEHVGTEHLGHAPRNWYIPNAEWHVGEAPAALDAGRFERVLCKTRQAERIFSALTDRAMFVGFESRDRRLPDIPRERSFMHAPGQSGFRGTDMVMRAWEHGIPATLVFPRAMPDEQYHREQNRCAFHLCPSEIEGWGHYIHEALGVGAIIVTTDAPPMNEIDGVAMCMQPCKREPFRMVERATVDRKAVAAAVNWCMSLDEAERERLSAAARAAFEAERSDFRARLLGLVGEAVVE